jgi:hypothetical protein
MSGYRPEWDVDKARGEEAEALVRKVRLDVLAGAIEVKRDDQALKTGNLYIEHKCRRADGWQPSGIAITKSDTWAIAVGPILLILPTAIVRALHERALDEGHRSECIVGSHPTQGALVPLWLVLPWAAQYVGQPIAERRAA